MHRCSYGLLTLLSFGLSLCMGQSQSENRDTLYLKNGGIISGTIVEPESDTTVMIRTEGGSIFVYRKVAIEKNSADRKPLEPDSTRMSPSQTVQGGEPGAACDGSGFVLFGAVSVPLGEFGNPADGNAPAAGVGYDIGVDASVILDHGAAWISTVNLSWNSVDVKPLYQSASFTSQEASWSLVWALTGLKVFSILASGVEVYGSAQAGLLFAGIPGVVLTSGGTRANQNPGSTAEFGYGIGTGLTTGRFSLSLRYMSGASEYTITSAGTAGVQSQKYQHRTSCFFIAGGIAF